MSVNWFTGDTHFGHENIINYSDRPYTDKSNMNESLINNWNSVVDKRDTVFHVGDIFFCKKDCAIEILSKLNGNIVLILGNHDKAIRRDKNFIELFHDVKDYLELNINKHKIVLSHYPMLSWNNSHRGSWMLHGHCHGKMTYPHQMNIHDVGVDNNNYFPLNYDTIESIMLNKGANNDKSI